MPYGSSDYIQALSANQCDKQNVKCAKCEMLYYRCYTHSQCPYCGEKKFVSVPWWYGMPVPGGNNIQGKVLLNGRKIIPKYFVEVRAFLNPNGDSLSSWVAAEKWFSDLGWKWVEEKEWYDYGRRIEKEDGLFFGKYEQ